MRGLPKWRRCKTSGAYSFLGHDAGGSLFCCEHEFSPRTSLNSGRSDRQTAAKGSGAPNEDIVQNHLT